jgi:hypothetical protein
MAHANTKHGFNNLIIIHPFFDGLNNFIALGWVTRAIAQK